MCVVCFELSQEIIVSQSNLAPTTEYNWVIECDFPRDSSRYLHKPGQVQGTAWYLERKEKLGCIVCRADR
jgi:Uma2 family endonuclease